MGRSTTKLNIAIIAWAILSALMVLFLVSLLHHPVVLADDPPGPTRYEYCDSGDDSAAQAYGDNWFAQTFTTTSSHTISQVKAKLYRTGTPGTFYLALRETDNATGHPIGPNLTYGSMNGDTLNADPEGEWYALDLPEISLQDDTKYALILWTGGSGSHSVHWLYDSEGTYDGGNYEFSINGGANWEADTGKDFMFEVWGNPTLEIADVKVFSSTSKDGDWLIVILYNCMYSPPFPAGNPKDCFYLRFSSGGNSAKVSLPSWGLKPAYIYLSPTTASGFTWGTGGTISIVGLEDYYGESPPEADYDLLPPDWRGANLFELDDWIRDAAQDIEDYYGVDIYLDFPEGEGVLTQIGSEIFLTGMPDLDKLRPHLFYETIQITDPEYVETEYTEAKGKAYEARFENSWVGKNLKYAGDQLHVKWNVITGIMVLGVIVALAIFCQMWYGSVKPVMIGGVLVMLGGTVMGWISAAIMAITTLLFALFLGYVWMFRHG